MMQLTYFFAIPLPISEQFAFDPFSITMFLYTMSILENKTKEQAKQEVRRARMNSIF